jgi:hypothetical protein
MLPTSEKNVPSSVGTNARWVGDRPSSPANICRKASIPCRTRVQTAGSSSLPDPLRHIPACTMRARDIFFRKRRRANETRKDLDRRRWYHIVQLGAGLAGIAGGAVALWSLLPLTRRQERIHVKSRNAVGPVDTVTPRVNAATLLSSNTAGHPTSARPPNTTARVSEVAYNDLLGQTITMRRTRTGMIHVVIFDPVYAHRCKTSAEGCDGTASAVFAPDSIREWIATGDVVVGSCIPGYLGTSRDTGSLSGFGEDNQDPEGYFTGRGGWGSHAETGTEHMLPAVTGPQLYFLPIWCDRKRWRGGRIDPKPTLAVFLGNWIGPTWTGATGVDGLEVNFRTLDDAHTYLKRLRHLVVQDPTDSGK